MTGDARCRAGEIWYEYARVDDHTMVVTFASQGPPWGVFDHVEVGETDTGLTITLYHGPDPDADPDEPCDGPPDRVFDVEVPLSHPFVPEEDVRTAARPRRSARRPR
jgi:hypothetical protein